MKVLSEGMSARPDGLARFLREARVQGQLEHPCVAPVYDLGTTTDRRPFFAMKRVRGTNLRQIIGELSRGEPGAADRHGRHTLLSAFARICLAVHAAHQRGVVHRDIKPENIMLGDYGEVYLLDWGIAGLIDAPDEDAPPPIEVSAAQSDITRAGEMLGTPQYMAPEQRFGAADPRADVYSLGAVLYEILTLQQYFDHQERASDTEAHAPPELIAASRKACESSPEDRYATAKLLHDRVQSYLEGNRDREQRQKLAAELAADGARDAHAAFGRGPDAQQARSRALRQIGRALALDSDNQDAARTLLELLTTPPAEIPPEAEQNWQRQREDAAVAAAHASVPALSAVLAFVPVILWMGTLDWIAFTVVVVAHAVAIGGTWGAGRWYHPGGWGMFWPLIPIVISTATLSVLFGPFVVVPTMAALCAASFALHLTAVQRWVMGALLCMSFLVPLALEWLGAVQSSTAIDSGVIQILPRAAAFPELPTIVFLAGSSVAFVFGAFLFFGSYREGLYRAQRQLYLQTWQLQQLLPGVRQ
jgi:serine/threonine-protein kinase